MTPRHTVIFAGGGSGGHIYPALAIAEQLPVAGIEPLVRFLCSRRPIDSQILRAEHLNGRAVRFKPIPAQPVILRPRGLARFAASWCPAVRLARRVLEHGRTRGKVVLVTTGGFVAAPVVQAARDLNIPRVMINLDAVPGLANRWIAGRATRVITSAPVPGRPWQLVRPIVRSAAQVTASPADLRRILGLDPQRPVLMVTGASQGAASINRFLIAFVEKHGPGLASLGWQILHQTGKSETSECQAAYAKAGIPAIVVPFVREMGQWWGAADAAVGRCGAGIVAEAWSARVPTLFLPYPYHRDQHQKANAAPMVAAGAALLADDRIEPAANLASVGPMLLTLLADAAQRDRVKQALNTLGPADGALSAARVVAELIGTSND